MPKALRNGPTLRTTLIIAVLALVAAALLPSTFSPQGQEAQAAVVAYRAGNAAFLAGQAGIFITFSVPMPDTSYAAVVQPTNTAGYSPTADCTYFNVLKKTTTNFQVQHKRCDDGVPVALDTNVSLNWIVWSYN